MPKCLFLLKNDFQTTLISFFSILHTRGMGLWVLKIMDNSILFLTHSLNKIYSDKTNFHIVSDICWLLHRDKFIEPNRFKCLTIFFSAHYTDLGESINNSYPNTGCPTIGIRKVNLYKNSIFWAWRLVLSNISYSDICILEISFKFAILAYFGVQNACDLRNSIWTL